MSRLWYNHGGPVVISEEVLMDKVSGILPLEHPLVEEARRRWDTRKTWSRHCDLSFDAAYRLFAEQHLTIGEAAKAAHLTYSGMQYLHRAYLGDICPIAACLTARRDEQARRPFTAWNVQLIRHAQFLWDPGFQLLRSHVREFGCVIDPVQYEASGHLNLSRVYIDGLQCALYRVKSATRSHRDNSKRLYGQIHLYADTLTSVDAVVVCLMVPKYPWRVFVYPSVVLREVLGTRFDMRVYFATERLPTYRGIKPVLDQWQFEDAFLLLGYA